MNHIFFSDSATLAFQPIINLNHTPFSNLSARAVSHWLELDSLCPAQWGAFMHFYGPTRKLLKMGGLDIEYLNFIDVKSKNKKWNQLIDQYQSNSLNPAETLYFIRLLYYLGFYEQGIQICEKLLSKRHSLEDKFWGIYLKNLGVSITQPLNWSPSDLEEITIKLTGSFLLPFHVCLLLAKFFIRLKKNYKQGIIWLDKAEQILDLNDSVSLGFSRLRKYKADALLLLGQTNEAKALLYQALEKIDVSILKETDESFIYLVKETKRRILDALIFQNIEEKNFKDALSYSTEAINIDPYCSLALAIAGSLAMKEQNNNLAYLYFQKSALFGIMERPYVKWEMARETQDVFNKKILNLEAIESSIDPSVQYEKTHQSAILKQVELPLKIQRMQNIAELVSENTLWDNFKNNPVYQRFLPFWELKESSNPSSLFCHIPLIALDAFTQNIQPWYQTVYLQRAMPVKFREELFFAVSPNTQFAQYYLNKGVSTEILQGRSEITIWLLEKMQTINETPILERTLFSRLLGSLGFYKEALRILPIPDKHGIWTVEEEYAYCTKLFFENIFCVLSNNFPYEQLEFIFNKLSNRSESLRIRLSLTILGSVFNGQRKNINDLKLWRDRGFKALHAILEDSHFDDFEKQILTSRFYRAVSFYPFLIEDYETLRREAELCESLARDLSPKNEKQLLLKKENLFPMLESMSRIYYQLGEISHSLNLMTEIIQIDPYDAKAWLQLGDMNEKLGLLEEAKQAYQNACALGVPMGGIAWYKLGRLLEKNGDKKSAQSYYWRSLKFSPKGLSPLKRLKELTEEIYLQDWCEKNLSSLAQLN